MMISPTDIVKEAGIDYLLPVIKQIDKAMVQFHGQFPWEFASILGEYSIHIRNLIGQKYKEVGWEYVYHKTSTECGDLPGLTMFIFSETPLDTNMVWNDHWTILK